MRIAELMRKEAVAVGRGAALRKGPAQWPSAKGLLAQKAGLLAQKAWQSRQRGAQQLEGHLDPTPERISLFSSYTPLSRSVQQLKKHLHLSLNSTPNIIKSSARWDTNHKSNFLHNYFLVYVLKNS